MPIEVIVQFIGAAVGGAVGGMGAVHLYMKRVARQERRAHEKAMHPGRKPAPAIGGD